MSSPITRLYLVSLVAVCLFKHPPLHSLPLYILIHVCTGKHSFAFCVPVLCMNLEFSSFYLWFPLHSEIHGYICRCRRLLAVWICNIWQLTLCCIRGRSRLYLLVLQGTPYSALQCTSKLRYTTVYHSMPQCITVYHSILQYTTV